MHGNNITPCILLQVIREEGGKTNFRVLSDLLGYLIKEED